MTPMSFGEALVDPTGQSIRVNEARLAPRPDTLTGLQIALVDNGKTNAVNVLSQVAAELKRSHRISSAAVYVKRIFSAPVEEDQIRQISNDCNIAIAGVGD